MLPPLNDEQFLPIVRHAPLLSIDLLIRDNTGDLLVGKRNNEPAKGTYFVPGGCIRKNERIDSAFSRILSEETSIDASIADARFVGVFEQFYPTNRFGEPGLTTHYVTLAYELKLTSRPNVMVDEQHSSFRWVGHFMTDMHPYTRVYF